MIMNLKTLFVIDKEPVLNDELIKLGRYISKDLSPLSSYQTMLPQASKLKGLVVNKNMKIFKIK